MIENGTLQDEPLLDVAVANENERGMLGIAVSVENDTTTTYVFVYFTESGGGEDSDDSQGVPPAGNHLYRYELQGNELVNPELLLDLPALPGPRYNGGPIAIGPDDNVYVINGDLDHHETKVQNFEDGPTADGSSGVLRVGKNGELPEPVIGTSTFGKYYFAYGIRNSFGMAFDPETGMLWDTENGPAFGEEVNLIEEGFNGGWRKVQGVANASNNLEDLVLFNARSHYSDPEFTWTEPIGVTGLAFLNSSQLGEEYEDDLFVGDINNGAVYHFDLNENRSAFELEGNLGDTVADTPEESEAAVFATGFGGVTDVKAGPDGYLYVVSYTEGEIFRILSSTTEEVQNSGDNNNDVDEDIATTADDEDTDDDNNTTNNAADDGDDGIAELTIRSADLSGNEITGMYTVVRAIDGDVLHEGFTPLTVAGDEGAIYIVAAADFGNREFDHWENDSVNMQKLVRLDGDTTITAYYQVESAAGDDEEEEFDD